MQVALATGQPLSELIDSPDETIATWLELLDEQHQQTRR